MVRRSTVQKPPSGKIITTGSTNNSNSNGTYKTVIWMPAIDSNGIVIGRKRAGDRVRRMRMRLVSHSKESYSLLSKKRYIIPFQFFAALTATGQARTLITVFYARVFAYIFFFFLDDRHMRAKGLLLLSTRRFFLWTIRGDARAYAPS